MQLPTASCTPLCPPPPPPNCSQTRRKEVHHRRADPSHDLHCQRTGTEAADRSNARCRLESVRHSDHARRGTRHRGLGPHQACLRRMNVKNFALSECRYQRGAILGNIAPSTSRPKRNTSPCAPPGTIANGPHAVVASTMTTSTTTRPPGRHRRFPPSCPRHLDLNWKQR